MTKHITKNILITCKSLDNWNDNVIQIAYIRGDTNPILYVIQ